MEGPNDEVHEEVEIESDMSDLESDIEVMTAALTPTHPPSPSHPRAHA